jgi:hypothetical protein
MSCGGSAEFELVAWRLASEFVRELFAGLLGAFAVDARCGVAGWWTERMVRVRDVVLDAVAGDGTCSVVPAVTLPVSFWWFAECFAGSDRVGGELAVGELVALLGERPLHG